MVIATLISIAQIGTAQFAPLDVPKAHWAYPAVNKLFEEGLLRGYSTTKMPQSHPAGKELDKGELSILLKQWLEKNLIRNTYSLLVQGRGGFSLEQATIYQSAVLVYCGWENICIGGNIYIEEHQDAANAIHTFKKALVQLGADPDIMLAKLSRIQNQSSLRFHTGPKTQKSSSR